MEGEMTESQREAVTKFLHKTVATVNCTWCGENQWGVEPNIVQLTQYFGPGVIGSGGPVYPLIMLVCGNCGHTMLFNALVMGIDRDKTESEEEIAHGNQSS
jgi:hypothetical protein